MKKVKTLICLGAMVASMNSYGVGLGVSASSDSSIIYLPIAINDEFRVEPLVAYTHVDYGPGDYSSLQLGVGAFRIHPLLENLNAYYGGRVSYLQVDEPQASTADGYSLAPTLGVEYFITDQVSVSGEADLNYQSVDYSGSSEDVTRTRTRMIVRFSF